MGKLKHVPGEKSKAVNALCSFRGSSSFTLPDGWEIEEKPRNNYSGHIDKYYIEPGTRKRFRSLISVERHLTEVTEHTPLQALIPAQNNAAVGHITSPRDLLALRK